VHDTIITSGGVIHSAAAAIVVVVNGRVSTRGARARYAATKTSVV